MRTRRRPDAPRVDDTRYLHAAGLRVERGTSVPAWASYLSLAEWRSLLDLLDGVASDPIFADQRFSPDLYWWCDGVLRLLPAAKTPAGPAVMPPDELMAALLEPGVVALTRAT